ncbi:MAG TPA: alpha/beta fold hydrolase [Holophagaceae bacterium]|nr:alpha/beta fold hydrolase [Holophagaceae bacterium]
MRFPFLVRLLLGCLGLYGAVTLAAFLLQRRMMYAPERYGEAEAMRMAKARGLEPWRDAKGALRGWRRAGVPGAPCVVVFHGNAGAALDRDYFVPLMGGREVILLEYQGYGCRPGEPSQSAMVADAAEALARLRDEGRGPILLLGESLGSGVAAHAAARVPGAVSGMLLVTPVARMADVAAMHYPWLPIRLLLRERWDNAAAIRDFPGPVAILVAGQDEVVGAAQGHGLAAACRKARLWEQPEAGHNSVDVRPGAAPWGEMLAWLDAGSGRALGKQNTQR